MSELSYTSVSLFYGFILREAFRAKQTAQQGHSLFSAPVSTKTATASVIQAKCSEKEGNKAISMLKRVFASFFANDQMIEDQCGITEMEPFALLLLYVLFLLSNPFTWVGWPIA